MSDYSGSGISGGCIHIDFGAARQRYQIGSKRLKSSLFFAMLSSVYALLAPTLQIDWTDSRFTWGFINHVLSAVIYAGFQICGQWVLGALNNEPSKCARYAGVYRGLTRLGLMVVFLMDRQGVSCKTQWIVQFVSYMIGLASPVGVTLAWVKESNYFIESDVIPPNYVEKEILEHEPSMLRGAEGFCGGLMRQGRLLS